MSCPNCGYCPHCGRGGYYTNPYPTPYWYQQPYTAPSWGPLYQGAPQPTEVPGSGLAGIQIVQKGQ